MSWIESFRETTDGRVREGKSLELENRLDELESELGRLKKLLFNDSEVILTIPLLKRDINSIREDIKCLRDEMIRMSDFTNWMIGITITISVGLFGLVISILLKG